MLEIADASINSLPYPATSIADSQFLTAILEELQALREEVATLREDGQDLKDKVERQQLIIDLYVDPDPRVLDSTHEECQPIREAVKLKTAAMKGYGAEIFELGLHVKMLEEGIGKGKDQPKQPTQKTLDHLTEIAVILRSKEKRLIEGQAPSAYLIKLRREGMTFSQLANVMGLTVDRIRQLSRLAATDQRFNICWHPRRKNTKIIKLRRWDAQEL